MRKIRKILKAETTLVKEIVLFTLKLFISSFIYLFITLKME